ncbi:hemaglutinin/autotransporter like protein [Caballeronia fortuita]|uniref:Hemaglutinin/autotransporter like protein n=1 Tax=Caballeronia fortuita TaxID=1777138 RepID=A0A158BCK1_9BURK|nr:hemaglutinin/autotransporter like protein [Caballeronia fortuita]
MLRRTDSNAGPFPQVARLAPNVNRSVTLRVACAVLSRAVKTLALLGLGGTASLSFAESESIAGLQSYQNSDMSAWIYGERHADMTMATDSSSRVPASPPASPARLDPLQPAYPPASGVVAYARSGAMRITFRSTERSVASGAVEVKAGHAHGDKRRRKPRAAPVQHEHAVPRRLMIRNRLGSDAPSPAMRARRDASSRAVAFRMPARAVDANRIAAIEETQRPAITQQTASDAGPTQNADASRLPHPALHAAAKSFSVAGPESVAVGDGAAASGERSSAFGEAAVARGVGSVAIGADSVADRDETVSVGSAGHERQITNVAPGTAPSDAVNLGQLNQATRGLNDRIDSVDQSARRGIASASALNIVTPYLPGRTTFNAGIANYRGQAALGIGVSRWNKKGNVNMNLGISTAGGNSTIVRVGIGIVLRA